MCESAGCEAASPFFVTLSDMDRLRAPVKDRNAPQKHVWRAKIVLLSAEGLGTNAICARPANPRPLSGEGKSVLRLRGSKVFCGLCQTNLGVSDRGTIKP